MLTLVLVLAAATTPGAGVIDSQRADDLMMPYQECMRRDRYGWFFIELRRCEAHTDPAAYKACAEAASERLQDRTPATHEECKPLIPTPGEVLGNLA